MSNSPARPKAASPAKLMILLILLAMLLAGGGTLAGVLRLVAALLGDTFDVSAGLAAATFLAAGWSAAAVLLALAWLVRRQHEASALLRGILAALSSLVRPSPEAGTVAAQPADGGDQQSTHIESLEQLLAELKEFNVNVLLTDDQREAKRQHRQWQAAERLAAEAEQSLDAGQFARTEELLEQLINTVPDDPRHGQLKQRLMDARAEAEADDIREQTLRAEELITAGSFDEAEEAAERLLGKHPSAARAIALLDRVRSEREAFVGEQRRRLYDELERHAESRRWRQALAVAGRLLDGYPDCPEAKAVAAIMPVLRDNARIEQVRELRDEIRNLLGQKNYGEALELAEKVIRQFPQTQAAAELRGQVERLRGLAGAARP